MFICFSPKKKSSLFIYIFFILGVAYFWHSCALIEEDASMIQVLKQPHVNSVYTRALNRNRKKIDSFIFSIYISNFVLISKYFLVFKQIKQTLYKSKLNYPPPKGQKKIKIQECFCIEKAY